ncbi:MAG: hypothetical protein QM535_21110 [Limnohabitans sp.]|nr:hypothetical protein [Limnohabitans sp.]
MENSELLKENKDFLFLFVDLIDSTKVADLGNEFEHKKYIGSFHWAVTRAKSFIQSNFVFPQAHFRRIIQNITISGDEVYSYSHINEDASESEKEDLIASSVSFIYMLQLYWLASPYNLDRLSSGKSIMRVSAGLHMGKAYDVPTECSNVLASVHIHVAKRIESKAKKGKQSNIYATNEVATYYHSWKDELLKSVNYEQLPVLSYTAFGKKKLFKLDGLTSGINLSELTLSYKGFKKQFNDLFNELITVSDELNYQAETASMIMSSNFLICRGNPFRYNDGRPSIPGYRYQNAIEYIKKWFETYQNSKLDFVDSPFMALNFVIISGSFLRHPEVTKDERKEYLSICLRNIAKIKNRFPKSFN